jgi:predicted Rossmann fold flavoprotein
MAQKHLIVIGGGAAGFFCAVNAARMNPQLGVILIEKTNKLLTKVKVSGGGRCNVTHACFSIPEMAANYPRGANFIKKAFHQFFTTDTISWFQDRGVELKTEEDGRMFPVTDSSQTIIDCLIKESEIRGVKIRMNREVKKLLVSGPRLEILLSTGEILEADFVCLACGGYPKSSMFGWLENTGHEIEEPVPSLFTFNLPANPITQMMGVSVADVQVKILESGLKERGPLLITHWGLSGPSILRLSAWGARELQKRNYEFRLVVNWVPLFNENSLRDEFQQLRFGLGPQKLNGKNPFGLPRRLWEYLLVQSQIDTEMRWADLPLAKQNSCIKNLCAQEFTVKGKTTFKEEFVTAGGIRLNEIDVSTMQSKRLGGLYIAGETMDVDGITGGFNFQHAWTSGYIAAKAIASL